MIDLTKGARPDEQFHLYCLEPIMHTRGWDWLYRSVTWTFPIGEERFTTYIFLWFFRWYYGTMKVDGGRTLMMWAGQLGEISTNSLNCYVMTTTPKELFSVRIRWRRPDRERPLNMGGI